LILGRRLPLGRAPEGAGVSLDVQKPPEGWVPVEHRFLGLDRRQFKPALFVLVVALVLIYGEQAISAAIPWHNPIKPGDVVDLGAGATAVPPVGWQLEDGALVGRNSGVSPTSSQTTLATGGARIDMQGAPFNGTAAAFLTQVLSVQDDSNAAVDGSRSSFTTAAGLVGVVQSESGPSGDQITVAFKMSDGNAAAVQAAPALLVVVAAAPGEFEQQSGVIQQFLLSVTPGEGE
jgi:hypothetical protein